MAVDPIRPVGPRSDLAPVERVQLTPTRREEEREQRRRRRRATPPRKPSGEPGGGLDVRA